MRAHLNRSIFNFPTPFYNQILNPMNPTKHCSENIIVKNILFALQTFFDCQLHFFGLFRTAALKGKAIHLQNLIVFYSPRSVMRLHSRTVFLTSNLGPSNVREKSSSPG